MARRRFPLIVFSLCFGIPLLAGSVVDETTSAYAAVSPLETTEFSPVLQRALVDPDFPALNDQGQLAVWVFFRDKGLSGAELEAALVAAESALPERTARRRAKMRTEGARLVDGTDLPVSTDYIARIEATGAVLRRTSRWLNAAGFQIAPGMASDLADFDFVEKLDLVALFKRPEIPTPFLVPDRTPERPTGQKAAAWTLDYGANLDAMEQAGVPAVHEMGLTGDGVVIGMLDTGFHPTHESLAGIPVLGSYDFVNNDANVDFDEGDPSNSIGHGTMTMSTAMGYMPGELVAPAFGASTILAKTEDVAVEIPIEEDHWVAGLEYVEALGADIVSSSLGYTDWYTFEDMDGNTAVTTIAADMGAGRGLLIITSSGNDRATTWGHLIAPADADSVITIGAVDIAGDVTYFSSPGPTYDGRIKPEVCALGYRNTVADPYDDIAYALASGTSFSCPLVSGVAALMLERAPSLTPLEVREALTMTASQSGTPDNDMGWGIIDAYAAVTYFGPKYSHVPLVNTGVTAEPYPVAVLITDQVGVDAAQVRIYYRLDGAAWASTSMINAGGDLYTGEIPGQPYGTLVEYYLEAASTNDVTTHDPDSGLPGIYYSFAVTPSSPIEDVDDVAPAVTSLGSAAPNPFNPRTHISFSLAEPGSVRLDVYDVKGQLVKSLVDDFRDVGPHAEIWNGRDGTGLEVGSGVYLYRLSTADGMLEGKMLLVR
jgi:Subtilase family